MNHTLAPNVNKNDKVILFDGVCKLCSGWARFIIRFDKKRKFKLATVQSNEGQRILAFYNLPVDHYDTMLFIDDEKLHTQSSAFIYVVKSLPFPWPLLTLFWLIPKPIRDWLYDRIALNRYFLFGRYNRCLLPTPDHDSRFVRDK